MIRVEPEIYTLIKKWLRNRPFTFFNPVIEPKLREAYETGINGVVLVFIDYGSVLMRGIMVIQEPDLQFYPDFTSIHQMVYIMIEDAITEYDLNREVHTYVRKGFKRSE